MNNPKLPALEKPHTIASIIELEKASYLGKSEYDAFYLCMHIDAEGARQGSICI